jgi:hypothetical protein
MSSLLPGNGNAGTSEPERDQASAVVPAKETPCPGIASWRFVLAFCVALAADTVGMPLGESFVVVFDVIVAIILIIILGFNWMFIPALLIECVPGLGVFPTWVMAVMAIAGWKTMNRK